MLTRKLGELVAHAVERWNNRFIQSQDEDDEEFDEDDEEYDEDEEEEEAAPPPPPVKAAPAPRAPRTVKK